MRAELRDVKRGNILWDKNSREPSPTLHLSMHNAQIRRNSRHPQRTGAQIDVSEKMQPTMNSLPRANFTFLPLSNPLMKSLSHLSKPARQSLFHLTLLSKILSLRGSPGTPRQEPEGRNCIRDGEKGTLLSGLLSLLVIRARTYHLPRYGGRTPPE